jgi:spermidine/putrescine transport system substrate-binding protein
MKRVLKLPLVFLLSLSFLAGCSDAGPAEPGVSADSLPQNNSAQLNLFTWEGMFPQDVLDNFSSETGITINYSNFDYDETMLAKLAAAKGGDYDLVIADDYIIQTVIAEGLAQKLDKSKIENYANINPLYQGNFYDEKDEYTVPYGAGVQTIVYDPSVIDKEITSYADLWDSALADNLGIVGSYRVINGLALKTMGESYNTEDVGKINADGEKLLALAPNIRLIKDDSLHNDLLSGEIGAAVMYTSQVTAAKMSNPDLKVVFPAEGIGFGVMANFIPSNAPNAEAAYKFINYILRPEISAQCFEALGYYCTNKAAEPFINEDYTDFLTLPEEGGANMEMIQNISADAEEAHTKIWTAFKAECGQQ